MGFQENIRLKLQIDDSDVQRQADSAARKAEQRMRTPIGPPARPVSRAAQKSAQEDQETTASDLAKSAGEALSLFRLLGRMVGGQSLLSMRSMYDIRRAIGVVEKFSGPGTSAGAIATTLNKSGVVNAFSRTARTIPQPSAEVARATSPGGSRPSPVVPAPEEAPARKLTAKQRENKEIELKMLRDAATNIESRGGQVGEDIKKAIADFEAELGQVRQGIATVAKAGPILAKVPSLAPRTSPPGIPSPASQMPTGHFGVTEFQAPIIPSRAPTRRMSSPTEMLAERAENAFNRFENTKDFTASSPTEEMRKRGEKSLENILGSLTEKNRGLRPAVPIAGTSKNPTRLTLDHLESMVSGSRVGSSQEEGEDDQPSGPPMSRMAKLARDAARLKYRAHHYLSGKFPGMISPPKGPPPLPGGAGAPGAGGMGGMLGNMSGMAKAGLAVGAIGLTLKNAYHGAKEVGAGIGQVAGSVATADASGMAKGMLKAYGGWLQIGFGPIVGPILKKFVGAIAGMIDGLDNLANHLAKFSGRSGAAMGRFQMQSAMFKVQAGQTLSPVTSGWLEVKTSILKLVGAIMPLAQPLANLVGGVLNYIARNAANLAKWVEYIASWFGYKKKEEKPANAWFAGLMGQAKNIKGNNERGPVGGKGGQTPKNAVLQPNAPDLAISNPTPEQIALLNKGGPSLEGGVSILATALKPLVPILGILESWRAKGWGAAAEDTENAIIGAMKPLIPALSVIEAMKPEPSPVITPPAPPVAPPSPDSPALHGADGMSNSVQQDAGDSVHVDRMEEGAIFHGESGKEELSRLLTKFGIAKGVDKNLGPQARRKIAEAQKGIATMAEQMTKNGIYTPDEANSIFNPEGDGGIMSGDFGLNDKMTDAFDDRKKKLDLKAKRDRLTKLRQQIIDAYSGNEEKTASAAKTPSLIGPQDRGGQVLHVGGPRGIHMPNFRPSDPITGPNMTASYGASINHGRVIPQGNMFATPTGGELRRAAMDQAAGVETRWDTTGKADGTKTANPDMVKSYSATGHAGIAQAKTVTNPKIEVNRPESLPTVPPTTLTAHINNSIHQQISNERALYACLNEFQRAMLNASAIARDETMLGGALLGNAAAQLLGNATASMYGASPLG